MNNAQVAVLVGSHRRESINAKLAQTQHSQVEWSAGRLPAPLNGDPVGNDTLIQIYLPSARRNSLHPNWSAPCLQGPSSNTPSPDSTEVEPARLRSRSRMYATAGRYAVLAKPKTRARNAVRVGSSTHRSASFHASDSLCWSALSTK